MTCPSCSTEFLEAAIYQTCSKCKKCVNPWTVQTALAGLDSALKVEKKLIVTNTVSGWKAIIQSQVPSAIGDPTKAILTDTYTLRLLRYINNNPPMPMLSLIVNPGDTDVWRVERPLESRFIKEASY